ncbi:MAG: hypothetical protein ABUS47_16210 [Steroidobacter sp.]
MTSKKYSYRKLDGTQRRLHSDEFLYCVDAPASAFENEFSLMIWRSWAALGDERPAAIWFRHRADAEPFFTEANPGTRPSLWWHYTWPQLHPGVEPPDDIAALSRQRTPEQVAAQQSFLQRFNLLTAQERKALPKQPRAAKPKLSVIKGDARG